MLKLTHDIQSLTDFKRRTAVFMKQLKEEQRPMVLTVNGRAELVVQDAVAYQKLIDLADRYDAIQAIQKGLEQAKRGEGIPLEKFDQYMRKKYGIRPRTDAGRNKGH
jgi:hypothetical protein